MTRADRLRQRLAERGLDGAVVGSPYNVTYLTGWHAGHDRPSLVVVGPAAVVLVAPGGPAAGPGVAVAGYAVPGPTLDRVVDVVQASADALAAAIEQAGLGGRTFGVEEEQITAFHARVAARHGATRPLAGEVEALRRIKDEQEAPLIRAAVAANDIGFQAARGAIVAGATELAVQDAIVAAIEVAAGVPVHITDGTNVIVSGPRCEIGVGLPTPRVIERGDLVIVDINPYIRGYKGDTTRTYCLGRPTPEQQRMHDALARALEAAERAARPGVPARDVYAALARPMVEAGFGAGVRNHGGHAMGLEHLERPYIIPGDEMPLAEGMLLTLEPGIYLPGIGGARLEDNYLVTADGLELLSHFPRELTVC